MQLVRARAAVRAEGGWPTRCMVSLKMRAFPPDERHLIALWSAVRDAIDAAESGALATQLEDPRLQALLGALAHDANRLAETLTRRILPPDTTKAPPPDATHPRVLVVDDEPNTLAALTSLIGEHYEVIASRDGSEAAALARERPPDAVVTDLRMPGVDGLGLLELLRGDRLTPAPPLLVVSASSEPEGRNLALERGAFDFMRKPVDAKELLARLGRAVRYGQELKREHNLQITDELTGLYNRRGFNLALQRALAHGQAMQAPVALALVDEDGLKQINDRFGHPAGDQCIVALARALEGARRSGDTVVRQGGDEFAVVMPGTTLEGARKMIERASASLERQPVEVEPGIFVQVRMSWGLACVGPSIGDAPALFAAADSALYAMKRQRKQAAPAR